MRNKIILSFVAIACILVFLYISSFQQLFFLNDDNVYIPASTHLNFLYGTSFRPVSDITLLMDYRLWGRNAAGYHFTNFFLHLLTTIVLFFLAGSVFRKYGEKTSGVYAPALVAVMFFFYPFHSEAIYWIIGRGGLLAALMGAACLLVYLERGTSTWRFALSIFLFLVGAFAYETIWIVPPIVLLISIIDIRKTPELKRKILRETGVFWLVFLIYIATRFTIIGEIGGTPYGNETVLQFDIGHLMKNYAIMIARSFFPPMQSNSTMILCCVVLMILLFFIAKRLINRPHPVTPVLLISFCFLISFLPVVNFGVDSHDTESERFLYFPSLFFVMIVVMVLLRLGRSEIQRRSVFVLLLLSEIFYLSYAASSYKQSSKIAAVSVSAVKKINKEYAIVCIGLPTQYRGALIFRDGFKEAVAWLTNRDKIPVTILSAREIYHPLKNFQAVEMSLSDLPPGDSSIIGQYFSRKSFLQTHSTILRWTDSSVWIIR